MTPVRLEPAASRSRVKHSTTEPLRSRQEASLWDIVVYKVYTQRLQIEVIKTKLLLIASRQKRKFMKHNKLALVYGNFDLQLTSCEKVWGVHKDDNITWTNHFQHVSKEIPSYLWLLFQIKSYLSLQHRVLVYNAYIKVSKGAKIRNRYNQVPHLTQDTNGKVTNSQLDATNESQEVSPFLAGDHKAYINRRSQRHSKHKTEKT